MVEHRVYRSSEVASFRFTNAPGGFLSNFAPGFPIDIPCAEDRITLDSTETLYQVMKFTHRPDLQQSLIEAASAHRNPPRGGKDFARQHNGDVHPDWSKGLSIVAMRYALRLKLAQHRHMALDALSWAGDRPIVEYSSRDDFWGAKPAGDGTLRGANVLGRLWMEIRQNLSADPHYGRFTVPAPGTLSLLGQDLVPWVRKANILNAHVTGKDVVGAVYVGRPSDFGNPIKLSDDEPRGATLERYAAWLATQAELVGRMRDELAGRDLICWCAPRACHAEIIRHVAAGGDVPGPDEIENIVGRMQTAPDLDRKNQDQISFDL